MGRQAAELPLHHVCHPRYDEYRSGRILPAEVERMVGQRLPRSVIVEAGRKMDLVISLNAEGYARWGGWKFGGGWIGVSQNVARY